MRASTISITKTDQTYRLFAVPRLAYQNHIRLFSQRPGEKTAEILAGIRNQDFFILHVDSLSSSFLLYICCLAKARYRLSIM